MFKVSEGKDITTKNIKKSKKGAGKEGGRGNNGAKILTKKRKHEFFSLLLTAVIISNLSHAPFHRNSTQLKYLLNIYYVQHIISGLNDKLHTNSKSTQFYTVTLFLITFQVFRTVLGHDLLWSMPREDLSNTMVSEWLKILSAGSAYFIFHYWPPLFLSPPKHMSYTHTQPHSLLDSLAHWDIFRIHWCQLLWNHMLTHHCSYDHTCSIHPGSFTFHE